MAVLFQTKPGAVVRLEDPALQCEVRFYSLDPTIDFHSEKSIVTRLTVNQQVNLQFLHTLGSQIFIYVFGDRIGQVGLSGLSFACICETDSVSRALGNNIHGAEQMFNWYRKHKASKRRQPVRVMIGNTPIEGFVTAFSEDVVDPSLSLVQWGVQLMTLPEEK